MKAACAKQAAFLLGIVDRSGNTTALSYDAAGRLRSLTDWSNTTTTYHYNSVGQFERVERPNGVQTAYTYDRSGRANKVVHANWRHWVTRYDYALDEAGNRTAVTESIRAPFLSYLPIVLRGPQRTTAEPIAAQEPGPDDPVNGTMEPAPAPTLPEFGERVVSHTYDSRSQLTRTAYRGDWGFTVTEIEYTYDSRGNLSRKQVTAGTVVTTESTFDRADQISTVDGRTYRYDARGNLIDDGVFTYTYDALDRMIEARSLTTTAVYTYNGDGLRIAQGIDGEETRFTWDPALGLPQLVAGSDGTRYLQGLGLEGVQQGDGAWSYPLPDLLGSVRQWSDAAGGVVATADYDPFGNLLSRTGDRPAPIGFAGEWEDAATGLQYLRARWYSPAQARFTQVDPFPGIPTLPGSQHPYSYVLNNPVNYTDPSGEIVPIVAAILISGLIGAVGAGLTYTAQHTLQPCEKFDYSALGRALLIGFVSGAVGGLVGWSVPGLAALLGGSSLAGFLTTLPGAFLLGAVSGALSAIAEQVVINLLTPEANWDDQLGNAALMGGIWGGISGIVGFGIRRIFGNNSISMWRKTDGTWSIYSKDGRIDYGEIAANYKHINDIPESMRGKVILHYHARGVRGIKRHRPWEFKAAENWLESFLGRF